MNDVTALPARAGRPFVAGPLLNVYNERGGAIPGGARRRDALHAGGIAADLRGR